LTLVSGVVFPAILALACWLFPYQAGGSLISRDGVVVGSELIAQGFSSPRYFDSRPSAAGNGYDPLASGGTNLGPANPKLRNDVRDFINAYRSRNSLSADIPVPIDAVARSGSGLDPHISPANAALQISRVAHERQLNEEVVRGLVDKHTLGRQFGLLGQPRVNVLELNLDLDRLPAETARNRPGG
jgi:K+-transporting ATPase ATPase C chain